MGKVRTKGLSRSDKDAVPKVSLKTIVKPKDKLKVAAIVPVQQQPAPEKIKGVFPTRPKLVDKRKQKGKKQFRKPVEDGDVSTASPLHQKKHVKMAEKKNKLMQKFELMLNEQKETLKKKRIEKANRKIGSVATMSAIKDALPSLDGLLKFKGADIKSGIPEYDSIEVTKNGKEMAKKDSKAKKPKNKFEQKEKRISKQSHENNKRYDYLQKLMNDKTFRSNPRKVIAEHIKNTLADNN